MSENESEKTCEFCDTDVDELYEASMPVPGVEYGTNKAHLCYVCFNSYCGNAHFYPEQYPTVILKTMAQHTNLILKAIWNLPPA